VVVAAALAPASALAQYENQALSLSAGYVALQQSAGVAQGGTAGLGWSRYLDNGFEWTANADAMLLALPSTAGNLVGFSVRPGVRYLFLQEAIRPWVGAALGYLVLFESDRSWSSLGLGPNAGLDVFITRQISFGVKVQLDAYAELREPIALRISFGGAVVGSAWF
jgi:outer membrane protein